MGNYSLPITASIEYEPVARSAHYVLEFSTMHEPVEPTEEQLQILNLIRQHPHISHQDLAKASELSVDQIGRRLTEMRENEWLDLKYIVDPVVLGYRLRYRVDVKINPLSLRGESAMLKGSKLLPNDNPQKILAAYIKDTLAEESRFKDRVMIEDITIVMGDPADLCVTLRVKDHDDILDFVTAGLRETPGIENTMTCLEAWSILTGKLSEAIQKKFGAPRG
jgi:DNA-binding Lrp family transcriptional regulator